VRQGQVDMEAHLVSEGLRKLASLYRLIDNGSISQGSILFWDEPEASLNPRLIELIVELLIALVAHGVQVILASHDYLLTHQLSIRAEHGRLPPGVGLRFFGLSRGDAPLAPVTVQASDTLPGSRRIAMQVQFLGRTSCGAEVGSVP